MASLTRSRLTKTGRAEVYAEQNRQAARIILADPKRYPGLMQEWARLVLTAPERRAA
jgi:hypothetical protein